MPRTVAAAGNAGSSRRAGTAGDCIGSHSGVRTKQGVVFAPLAGVGHYALFCPPVVARTRLQSPAVLGPSGCCGVPGGGDGARHCAVLVVGAGQNCHIWTVTVLILVVL